jgi:hypothetical protein
MPLGSSENRGRHDCNHASSAPPGPRPFSWGGVTIPMVMTVRLVIGLSTSSEGEKLASFGETGPQTRLASFGETVRAVWRKSSIDTNCQRAAHARTPASSSGDAASASRESVEEDWRRRGGHRRRRQVFDGAGRTPFTHWGTDACHFFVGLSSPLAVH